MFSSKKHRIAFSGKEHSDRKFILPVGTLNISFFDFLNIVFLNAKENYQN